MRGRGWAQAGRAQVGGGASPRPGIEPPAWRFDVALARAGLAVVLAVLLTLLACALAWTYGFPASNLERPRALGIAQALASVPVSALALLACLLARDRLASLDRAMVVRVCCLASLALAVGWAFVFRAYAPTADQLHLIWLAQGLAGDPAHGAVDRYLRLFPYQSGYVLVDWALGRLSGFSGWGVLRLPGIVSAPVIVWASSRVAAELFRRPEAANLAAVLAFAFLPIGMYSVFVYGSLPALATSLVGMVCQGRSVAAPGGVGTRLRWALLSALSLFAAVWLKPNSLIFVAAAEAAWASAALTRRSALFAAMLVVNLLAWVLGGRVPVAIVEGMAGTSLGPGVPKAAWVVMGLNDDSPSGPGWFDGYVYGYSDAALATEGAYVESAGRASSALGTRVGELSADPARAARILGFKVLSQWTEPTFQALWQTYSGGEPLPGEAEGGLSDGIDYGSTLEVGLLLGWPRRLIVLFLDAFQTLVYAGAALGVAGLMRRRAPVWALAPCVAFLGGFLFHLVWEAKSCYALSYFVLLLPLAAVGITCVGRGRRTGRVARSSLPPHRLR